MLNSPCLLLPADEVNKNGVSLPEFIKLCHSIESGFEGRKKIFENDQLKIEQQEDRAWSDFQENPSVWRMRPTFKVERYENPTKYNPQRAPAWSVLLYFVSLYGVNNFECH